MKDTDASGSLKDMVARVLAEDIGPSLQLASDGIEVVDVTDGVVQVRLHGVCAGCPSTTMALLMGMEQELRSRVPGVEYFEVVP